MREIEREEKKIVIDWKRRGRVFVRGKKRDRDKRKREKKESERYKV